jgi:hypothetical protein
MGGGNNSESAKVAIGRLGSCLNKCSPIHFATIITAHKDIILIVNLKWDQDDMLKGN